MQLVYKELETVIEINGIEANATITIGLEEDDNFSSDDIDFENELDKETFDRRIDRGTIQPTVVSVEVTALGETETVSLGSVLVESSKDVDDAVEEYGLVAEATEHLIKTIEGRFETLKPYFRVA